MKKKIVLAIVLVIMCRSAYTQLLTVIPSFPVDTSTITIIADCSKGNQGLYNYGNTADVYVHTGVITDQSTTASDWRYVKFNQNFNSPNPALQATYLGNNKYSFKINDIRNFYGVPSSEQIRKIAILFRNGAGTSVLRNKDASDMYLQIYDGSLAIQFVWAPFQPTYIPVPEPINVMVGDNLAVKIITNKSATLHLNFNGLVVNGSGDSLAALLPITASGLQQIIAQAGTGTENISDTLSFYVAGTNKVLPLPASVREGANYLPGDTSVILVLFAPQKNKVNVIGDFNNWQRQISNQMNITPDGNYFWLEIDGLTPSQEYAYQYSIDDTITVADYNAEKILDKNVDPYIPALTYPNLKSFPVQASGTLVSVIQTAQPAYRWQLNNFQRPDKRNLLVYELLVRDFTAAGNWQTLRDTLDYLQRLGINAIELMPINNFEGLSSWGYNPNFYFVPDKVYGTENALKEFIDSCHGRGFAVIMDMVLNHSFGSSPMVQMYWDPVNNIPAANSPWFNQYPTHAYNVGYQFNHESPATQKFTQRVMAHWLTNYHVDGFRFDLAKGFTQKRTCDAQGNNCDVNAWGNYDSSRVRIWDSIYTEQQLISSGSYCILEMFADNAEQAVEASQGMLLWGNLNYNFNQATMGYSTGWDFSGALYATLGWSQPHLVAYQESHDEERLMYKNEQYGNSSGSYNIKDIPTGLKRNEMATAFWALIPGPKMCWEFGELGYDWSINTCLNGTVNPNGNCRLDPKPLPWNYYKDPNRLSLFNVYARLFSLRKLPNYISTFTTGKIQSNFSAAIKWMTLSDDSLKLVVVGNFDVIPSSTTLNFPSLGKWYSYLTDSVASISSASQLVNLKPGEYYVFTDKNIKNIIDTAINPPAAPESLSLRISPNPTSGQCTIYYGVPSDGRVDLSLINVNGQRVMKLFESYKSRGFYSIPFQKGQLAAGMYFVQMLQNGRRTTGKLMTIR